MQQLLLILWGCPFRFFPGHMHSYIHTFSLSWVTLYLSDNFLFFSHRVVAVKTYRPKSSFLIDDSSPINGYNIMKHIRCFSFQCSSMINDAIINCEKSIFSLLTRLRSNHERSSFKFLWSSVWLNICSHIHWPFCFVSSFHPFVSSFFILLSISLCGSSPFSAWFLRTI